MTPAMRSGAVSFSAALRSVKRFVPGGAEFRRDAACHPLDVEVWNFRELRFEFGADLVHLLGAIGELLARAFVEDDDRDVGEAFALLLLQDRIEEGCDQRGKSGGAQKATARTPEQQHQNEGERHDRKADQDRQRKEGREGNRPVQTLSLYCPSLSRRAGT